MAIPEHIEIFEKGPDKWNQWLKHQERADLSGLNVCPELLGSDTFQGYCLEKTNCQGMYFDSVKFRNDTLGLTQSIFFGEVDFNGFVFENAFFQNCYFYGCEFSSADFSKSNSALHSFFLDCKFIGTSFAKSVLRYNQFLQCDFSEADMTASDISNSNLSGSVLRDTKLCFAAAKGTNFSMARLNGAKLNNSILEGAIFVEADLSDSNISNSRVYGTSTWNANFEGCIQNDLVVTKADEPLLTTDNLEIAQFLYLLIENSKIKEVIDTVASRVVLILGRFTTDRKDVLDQLKAELRKRDLIPVLFDFERPEERNLNETVSTIAHMSKFVVADVSEPKCLPQELMVVAPQLTSVPVQLVIEESQEPYSMLESILVKQHVLDLVKYRNSADLMDKVPSIIEACESKSLEMKEVLRRAISSIS